MCLFLVSFYGLSFSNLKEGLGYLFFERRHSSVTFSAYRLQKISPVNYSEQPNEKKSVGEKVLTDEGLVPEVYTEKHEKLLGSCQNAWVLFQDGYGRDGKRIYDSLNGKTCHQCRLGFSFYSFEFVDHIRPPSFALLQIGLDICLFYL